MTYSEYLEKNNISFNESMKLFNKSNFDSFDEFLKSEYRDHKFNDGDIVVLQLNAFTKETNWKHNVVFMINKYSNHNEFYRVKFLTPTDYNDINDVREFPKYFIDDNCKLY